MKLYQAPVNNVGLDPLQGFDFECWCQDVASGKIAWFGKFQSLTLSVRDATETYLELGQRIPIYLNGEIQVAWVLEQGLVDMSFIRRTFGADELSRQKFITRGPRFQITFDANAAELNNVPSRAINDTSNSTLRQGPNEYSVFKSDLFAENGVTQNRGLGRYELIRCKVDSVSLGIMPGRRVAAVRWEGVSEGLRYQEDSVQEFKTKRSPNNSGGFAITNTTLT